MALHRTENRTKTSAATLRAMIASAPTSMVERGAMRNSCVGSRATGRMLPPVVCSSPNGEHDPSQQGNAEDEKAVPDHLVVHTRFCHAPLLATVERHPVDLDQAERGLRYHFAVPAVLSGPNAPRHVACASSCMPMRTSLEEGIKLHGFAGIFPEQFFTEAGRHREAVVAAGQRMIICCFRDDFPDFVHDVLHVPPPIQGCLARPSCSFQLAFHHAEGSASPLSATRRHPQGGCAIARHAL